MRGSPDRLLEKEVGRFETSCAGFARQPSLPLLGDRRGNKKKTGGVITGHHEMPAVVSAGMATSSANNIRIARTEAHFPY